MLEKISLFLWSVMLFPLLASGVYLTIRLGFIQLRIKKIFGRTFLPLFRQRNEKGELSQLQAVCTSLAATMGTGNIVGVASALTLGGAGSVFWMWVSAFFGMALAYAENFLAVKYRKLLPDGTYSGGAMMYIEKGLHCRTLALIYAVFCILSSLGMGNMTQSNSIADALPFPKAIVGGVCAILIGIIILGGVKRIGSAAEKIIPFLSALYILVSIILIVYNYRSIPAVISDILSEAFGLRAICGGTAGYAVRQAVVTGLRRGVFSNEAGLGSAGIIHSAAPGCSPEKQGLWGIAEVFLDTIVCCSLTAFAILSSGAFCKGISLDGSALVIASFEKLLGGVAPFFIGGSICLFAFATLIGWEMIGEKAWKYLFKGKSTLYYKYIYIIFILIGATISLESVWYLSDIFNALMIIPNLIAVVLLSREVVSSS